MRLCFVISLALFVLAPFVIQAAPATVIACPPGKHIISGKAPVHTALLLYFDDQAIGGGTSDASGVYRIPLVIDTSIRRGSYPVAVTVRETRRTIQELTCVVPGPEETARPAAPNTAATAASGPTPTVASTATAQPSSTPNPAYHTNGRDLYNCTDFSTWEEANQVYQANLPGDPNRLDNDNDGIPCETLPGAP